MASPTFSTVLSVDRMVHGGNAIGRLADGRIALVSGAVPGERVAVELSERKGVLLGSVVDVIEPSPDRVPTPRHPGLDYGHVAYPRQLELKREVLADALARAGVAAGAVPAVRPAPAQLAYRSVVQPAVVPAGLGYRRPGSDEVVVLDGDPTAYLGVATAWSALTATGAPRRRDLREVVIRANDAGEALVALIGVGAASAYLDLGHRLLEAGAAGVSFAPYDPRGRFRGGAERLAGRRFVTQRYGDVELTVSATAFAQPNPEAAGALYQELARWAGEGDRALELFAGGGAIAMHLAPRFAAVTALEVERSAVTRGERDAERLGLKNVAFVRADARRVRVEQGVDLVVVDPPRAGLAADVRATLAGAVAGGARLVYVACDVATWARDVADLRERGLRLERFEPFDFYPHTHHIEVLSLLTAGAGGPTTRPHGRGC